MIHPGGTGIAAAHHCTPRFDPPRHELRAGAVGFAAAAPLVTQAKARLDQRNYDEILGLFENLRSLETQLVGIFVAQESSATRYVFTER